MADAMVSVGLRQNIRWLKQQRFQTVKSRPLGRTSRPQYLSDSARLVHRQDRDGHGRWAVIAFSGEVIASCNSFAVDALAISAAGGKSMWTVSDHHDGVARVANMKSPRTPVHGLSLGCGKDPKESGNERRRRAALGHPILSETVYLSIPGAVDTAEGPSKFRGTPDCNESAALHSSGLDAHCRSVLRNPTTGPDPKAFKTFRRVLEIDAKYYPETLGVHIMINCPWIFTGVWRIIKPWIDPARRDSAEDFSRLNALLCTAVDRILIPAYCFANS